MILVGTEVCVLVLIPSHCAYLQILQQLLTAAAIEGKEEHWNPFGEILSLRDAMNWLFEESFARLSRATGQAPGRTGLPVDLYEIEDQYVLEAALP